MTLDPRRLLDFENIQNPYALYDTARTEAPVWDIGSGIYAVSAFAPLVDAARRVTDFSSNMKGLLYKSEDGVPAMLPMDMGNPTLATADPPQHTAQKQMIFPKFVAKRMELIEPELTAFVHQRIDSIDSLAEFDFMEEIGGAVPIHAISQLIGFRHSNDQLLRDTAYDSVRLTGGTKTLAELGQVQMRIGEIQTWFKAQLDERDGVREDDLLDAVKAALVAGKLSEGEAIITLMILLSAGGESTASLLGNSTRILAERPELVARLRADRSLLVPFIEEALRLESPFQHMLRSVPHDTRLQDVPIPAGSTLILLWGAANRDPEKFDDPTDLVFGRKLQHVTFGRGIHQCVGSSLARLEARIVLNALLDHPRFPTLSSSDKPEYEYSLQVRRHRRLPMAWN